MKNNTHIAYEQEALNKMSVNDLYKLHYEKEIFFAQEALKLMPFSKERYKFLSEGIHVIRKIKDARAIKETGLVPVSAGSTLASVNILVKLIKKKLQENGTNETVLYEAGVGKGFAIKQVLGHIKSPALKIFGCDFVIDDNLLKLNDNARICLTNGNVYDCISELSDSSIDIFFADNVFEHFMPDEAEEIYSIISQKLKANALVFLVIPNSYTGPHDISRRFLPKYAKATGFHFMEMTFNEVTDRMKKYGISQKYCVLRIPRFVCIKSNLLLRLKLCIEPLMGKIPFSLFRKLICVGGGYFYSVLQKDIS